MNEARGMSSWLEPKTPNIAALLRGAGYRTAHIGKWHLGNDANGPATREYGFDFVGTSEGGAGVRVPFIVRWPGKVPAGRVNNETVAAGVDLLPTLCKLASVEIPKSHALDGEELSDVWLGKARVRAKPLLWEWRFQIFGERHHRSPMLSIRDGKWKLLMNPDRSRVELYDIPADPGEVDNVADRHPEVVARMSKTLLEWQTTLPKGPSDPGVGKNDYPWPKQAP
jgi:arylsulfatase A-like enzyme